MNIEKKLLILAIILIFSGILYNLMHTRVKMKAAMENFTIMNSEKSEINKMTVSETGPGVTSINTKDKSFLDLPIREFCVKSSFNSACSGSYMSVDTISYVLSRGCRFLDFEVYLVDDILCVGVSNNPLTGSQNITSTNTISLDAAFRQIITSGFSSPAPNPNDPLFVRIRLQTKNIDVLTSGVYNNVAMVIKNTLINRLYSDNVTSTTPINALMGKVVLVWDKISSGDYISDPKLTALVNMESGGDSMRTLSNASILTHSITPPHIHDDNNTSDVLMVRNISPDNSDSATSNPDSAKMISDYGIQFVCNRFYITDRNLANYEEFFRYGKCAFVPFSTAIPYLSI